MLWTCKLIKLFYLFQYFTHSVNHIEIKLINYQKCHSYGFMKLPKNHPNNITAISVLRFLVSNMVMFAVAQSSPNTFRYILCIPMHPKKIQYYFQARLLLALWLGWVVAMFLLNVSMVQWDSSSNYSLLHPLRLVVGTKRNATKQNRCVKFHADIVPEWTKWVPILKINQNNPFM